MQDTRRHGELFGELQSINNAVAQLSGIGVSLDTIIELLKQPALHQAHGFDTEPGTNSATTIDTGFADLDAEYTAPSRPPVRANLRSEHNHRARLYNGLGEDGDFVLMPLRDQSNRVVSSFPRTLGQLAHFPDISFTGAVELTKLLRCFHLSPDLLDDEHQQLCELVGINLGTVLHVQGTYTLPSPRPVADFHAQRESLRDSTVRYAAPPTRTSQGNIASALPPIPRTISS